tara:strand:+ start:718 stop:1173 length:456 start_codon:yes stop_codon:yes gene_type:complete
LFSLDSKLSIWDTDKEFNFEDGVDIVTMNTFGAFGTATIELCEVKKYDGWIKEIKTENHTLTVTENLNVIIKDNKVFDIDLKEHEILSIENIRYTGDVMSIVTDLNYCFVNGVLVKHQELEIEDVFCRFVCPDTDDREFYDEHTDSAVDKI